LIQGTNEIHGLFNLRITDNSTKDVNHILPEGKRCFLMAHDAGLCLFDVAQKGKRKFGNGPAGSKAFFNMAFCPFAFGFGCQIERFENPFVKGLCPVEDKEN
jgi:hypothetical protein